MHYVLNAASLKLKWNSRENKQKIELKMFDKRHIAEKFIESLKCCDAEKSKCNFNDERNSSPKKKKLIKIVRRKYAIYESEMMTFSSRSNVSDSG